MQTFLPYPSFTETAKVLDNKRLGKQRVECLQILKSLTIPGYGWGNHPIVRMWKGHEKTLCHYGFIICDEWTRRGFNDTVRDKIRKIYDDNNGFAWNPPNWMTNSELFLSHQSNLLRKDYNYYKDKFPFVESDLPYQWYNPNTGMWYTK